MLAPTLLRRVQACCRAVFLYSLALSLLGAGARAADLGLNPIVGTGTQTLGTLDLFTGTLSVGTAGQSGGSLTLTSDYTTGLSLAFTGTSSALSYSTSVRTLTLLSTATFSRTGTGTTTVYDHLNNAGTVTVSGGTLSFLSNTTLTNSGNVSVSGSGSILSLGGLANTGTLSASSSGILKFAGSIATASLGNVTLSTGARAELTGTLTNTSATLNAPTGGIYELVGGTLVGGTVASNALTFTTSGGTLNGPTLTGTVTLPANTYAYVNGNTTLSTASVTFGNSAYLYLSGGNSTLTISPATSLTGDLRIISDGSVGSTLTHQGNATHTDSSSGQLYAKSFTNSGTITATAGTLDLGTTTTGYDTFNTGNVVVDGASAKIYVAGNVTNTGTLLAKNSGVLQFTGTNTTAHLGNVTLTSGGRALLNGTLTNTAATLTAPTGGRYELFGGTIVGGTVNGSALTLTTSGGTLNGVTLTGNATLPANTYAYIAGNTTLSSASVTFEPSAYFYLTGANTELVVSPTAVLTGDIRLLSDGSVGSTLTHQGNTTHSDTSSGQLYAKSFTNSGTITATAGTLDLGTTTTGYDTFNTGSVIATGSGTKIYVAGNVTNTGTLRAENSGILQFTGANTTAHLGNVTLTTGGRALLNGTLTNTAATLSAPTGGTYELFGGTIVGGTVNGSALTFTSSGGTLNGATLTGAVTFPDNTYTYVSGNTTLSTANVTFGSGAYFYLTGGNSTLTTNAGTTLTGDVSVLSDGSIGSSFLHLGNATHTSTTSGQLYAKSFTNSGTISATAGTLTLGTTTTGYDTFNTGSVIADGATVYLSGNVSNTGTLTAQNSGLLRFNGTNPTGLAGNVTLATGGRALLEGTLTIPTTLTAPTGGAYELHGGTLLGGTVAAGALTFTNTGGTLNGVTVADDLTLPSGTYVYFTNGAAFSGNKANLESSSGIYWQQTATLAGKALTFANNSYLYVSGANNALTLSPTTTATGDVSIYSDSSTGTSITNQGTLTHTTGSGQLYARTLTNAGNITATGGTLAFGSSSSGYDSFNSGTITASGSTAHIDLYGNVTNTGTLRAENSGELDFAGTNSSGNLGNVTLATGGRALLSGTLTNTAANLAAPTGGSFELYGGTINGGTIAAGALTFTSSGGTLNASTITGDLTFPASTYAYFTGNTTFTGGNASLGGSSGIYWQQVATLTGKSLTLANGAYLYVSGANHALTLAPSTALTGDVSIYSDSSTGTSITNQGTLTHTTGSGQLYARTLTNAGTITATGGTLIFGSTSAGYDSVNSGTLTVNGSGVNLYVQGNVTNTGTLRAENSGTLIFNGANTSSHLGNVTLATSGRALLNGTLDNTSATLAAPSGGYFELYNGTITGGSIAATALGLTSSGGTLNGVTLLGDFGAAASTYATITGGSTFTGGNATFANSSGIYWQQVGTLTGKTITLGNGAYVYVSAANSSLTLAPTTTATGDISFYSDSSAGTVITNQGTLTHSLGTGNLYARTFTNSGTISATAGTLSLGTSSTGYTFTNAPGSTLTVAGGSVFLNAPTGAAFVNQGTINAQSGTLYTNNVLTQAAGSTLTGAGNISGNVKVEGGTIAPGNSGIGALLFNSGTLTITGATVFAFDINGGTADRLSFQNPPAPIDLGAGLVSLSLNFLAAPTVNTTYPLVQITAGGSGITGTFAGLPTSGLSFNASYLGTPYTFTVNYATNLVSLTVTPIPEPSTWALLITGLGLAFFLHRRRK